MYLIDTSAWIFALRKKPIEAIQNRVDELLEAGSVAIIGLIRLELLGGTKTETEFRRLGRRLSALIYLQTTAAMWDRASQLLFDLRRRGVTIPPTDALIAACSIDADAVLVHADAHFDLAAQHTALKVESMGHFL